MPILIGVFFILLAISLFLNKFTRGVIMTKKRILINLILLLLGIVILFFSIGILKTKTVYTVNLQKVASSFSGSFKMPEDINLNINKKHTFFVNIGYGVFEGGIGGVYRNTTLKLNFKHPGGNYDQTLQIFEPRNSGAALGERKTKSVSRRSPSNYDFTPSSGAYLFNVTETDHDPKLNVSSVSIEIREYR